MSKLKHIKFFIVLRSFNCSLPAIIEKDPNWYNYFLCGLKGIEEHYGTAIEFGIDVLVDGTIPPAAGLSSSSAFVCCAALTVMRLLQKSMTRVSMQRTENLSGVETTRSSCLLQLELANVCQRCERYIGTEGGGMDQSISFLAEEGKVAFHSVLFN